MNLYQVLVKNKLCVKHMGFYFNQQLVGSYFNQPQNISESVHAEMNNIYVICYIFILYNLYLYMGNSTLNRTSE